MDIHICKWCGREYNYQVGPYCWYDYCSEKCKREAEAAG